MLSVIELMVVLVDWINVSLVMEDSGLLLQLLYEMLSLTDDVSLQLAAVDLLLAIAGRKVVSLLLYILSICLPSATHHLNPLTPAVAIWVQLQSILCQTKLSSFVVFDIQAHL